MVNFSLASVRTASVRTAALMSEWVYFAFLLVGLLRPLLLKLVMLWWLVSMIFFIVICRSISYMVVPFNLYSLGYFLKQFIGHYPKLNCIYYPLTQVLKWSTSI